MKSWPAASEARASSTWLRGLEAEIDLLQHHLGEQLHEPGEVGDAGRSRCSLGGGSCEGHRPEVALQLLTQVGTTDLHHHPGAVVECGCMDLSDGSRSERLRVEVAEHRLQWYLEPLLETLLGQAGWEGSGGVSAPAERLDPLAGE